MTVETTIVVEFNGGTPDAADYLALVELDDIANDSKTSFLPGEQPVVRAQFSSNIRLDDVVATAGGVVHDGAVDRTRETEILFTSRNVDEPTESVLPIIPLSTSVEYAGRAGSYKAEGLTGGRVNIIGDIEKTPFLAKFTNLYKVNLYRLIPPTLVLAEDETYTIYMVFYLTFLET